MVEINGGPIERRVYKAWRRWVLEWKWGRSPKGQIIISKTQFRHKRDFRCPFNVGRGRVEGRGKGGREREGWKGGGMVKGWDIWVVEWWRREGGGRRNGDGRLRWSWYRPKGL